MRVAMGLGMNQKLVAFALTTLAFGCSSSAEPTGQQGSPVATTANVPSSKHVWMITEENYSYEGVIGNTAMPYFNKLATTYGLATQYYSDQHSSLPALMWLVAGAPVEPNNDTVSCQHSEDNIVRELLKHGYSWRAYEEDMPSAGYQSLYGGTGGYYYRRHNPLIDFTDVCPGTGQEDNSVPYTQLSTDLAKGFVANYAYITPDAVDDLHSGTAQAADGWLASHVPQILALPEFKPGGDGILFVTFDEADLGSDNRCSATVTEGCGGHVATLVIGPTVTPGFKSTTTYHHENLLKTVCVALGLSTCPGAAESAAPMADFFGSAVGTGITITSPGSGATTYDPVHLIASAKETVGVAQMQVWDNGVKLGWYAGSSIDETYTLAAGAHTTTVLDLDSSNNVLHKQEVSFTVATEAVGVTIVSPTKGESLPGGTPVHVVANAFENEAIGQLQVWDNGTKLGAYPGSSVNQYFTLAPGAHTTTIIDLDDSNAVIHTSVVSYTVEAACAAPVITDPTESEEVGPAIDVQASAPPCIVAMDAYLDGNPTPVAKTSSNAFASPTWVAVGTGSHTLQVNGWDATGAVHVSTPVTFKR